ncbi:MAG: hypothetical protein WC015_05735 [Methanoregula sp.]
MRELFLFFARISHDGTCGKAIEAPDVICPFVRTAGDASVEKCGITA